MNNSIRSILIAAALTMGHAASTQAAVITGGDLAGTDVGSVDTLLSTTNGISGCGPGGSTTVETCWVNSVLGAGSASYFDKEETVSYYGTDTANVFAFALTGDPGYYLIKNSTFRALFRNENSTDWAVFSTLGLSGFNLGGAGQLTISHVTTFNGTTQVPEPATLALLGAGLLGIGIARRRRAAA